MRHNVLTRQQKRDASQTCARVGDLAPQVWADLSTGEQPEPTGDEQEQHRITWGNIVFVGSNTEYGKQKTEYGKRADGSVFRTVSSTVPRTGTNDGEGTDVSWKMGRVLPWWTNLPSNRERREGLGVER